MSALACSWCRRPVAADEGYLVYAPGQGRQASFCRLEHVIPWVIRGARWPADQPEDEAPETPDQEPAPTACSHCGRPLADGRILLVHHRGRHRIVDGFCDVEHMRAWVSAGGRWR